MRCLRLCIDLVDSVYSFCEIELIICTRKLDRIDLAALKKKRADGGFIVGAGKCSLVHPQEFKNLFP